MDLIKRFSNSEIEDISLLIRCLLDRIPIIILSDQENVIENLMNELVSLIPFRNAVIFLSDFLDNDDYSQILEYEDYDLNNERNVFLSFPNTTQRAMELIQNFNSWIIGVQITKQNYSSFITVHNKVYSQSDFFLKLEIENENLKAEIIGKKFQNLNISLERWIYQNAINRTEVEIEKMKRVLLKRTRFKKIPDDQISSIMNFDVEEGEIKENIIKKEILNFFNACKRSINILNRMKILESFKIQTKLSPRTLYSTIAYKNAHIERILHFIFCEWKEDFFSLLNFKETSNFTDTFESLWG